MFNFSWLELYSFCIIDSDLKLEFEVFYLWLIFQIYYSTLSYIEFKQIILYLAHF